MTRFHRTESDGSSGRASAHQRAWRSLRLDHQAHDGVAVRIRHAFSGADRIALNQAIDDLGPAGERQAVHFSPPWRILAPRCLT
jgi:hypothetical protein